MLPDRGPNSSNRQGVDFQLAEANRSGDPKSGADPAANRRQPGRLETTRMLPLARAEIESRTPTFPERRVEGKIQS
jgi:hypothetical protein